MARGLKHRMTPERRAFIGKAATLGFDVASAMACMFVAVQIAFMLEETSVTLVPALMVGAVMAGVFGVCAAFAFVFLKVHHQVWRHMGWPDAVKVGQAAMLTVLMFVPFLFLFDMFMVLPRTAILIVILVWLTALFAGRMAALTRSTENPTKLFARRDPGAQLVLLVGRTSDVAAALRNRDTASAVRALGILTLDTPERGRAIQGVPLIGGVSEIGDAIDLMTARYEQTPWVAVVGDPKAPRAMAKLLSEASDRGSKLMALSIGGADEPLRRLKPADLLGRKEHAFDPENVRTMVQGARVLVTGAGGSIGSALVRACAGFAPKSLHLIDSSEFNLYMIDSQLRDGRAELPVEAIIGDVRDEMRMQQVIDRVKPDVVLHAAALKHVPLVEANPCEAVLTNVMGAMNVARAACRAGASRFVFISSDKAASPSNAMGATKRLAEQMLAAFAPDCTGMAVAMVRFGNVLGSSGSVVPRFERQIEAGGPVTVSHRDMTRYFMTIEEAANLVLAAGSLARPGGAAELFMLDMGEPIRVLELAETMIRLSGKVPYSGIEIVFSGQRPGDRIHESLVADGEELIASELPGIQRVRPSADVTHARVADVERLFEEARRRNEEATRQAMAGLVEGYLVA